MKSLVLQGHALRLQGAIDLIRDNQGVQPIRLPAAERPLFDPWLWSVASCAAGVRLSLRSDSRALEVDVAPAEIKEYFASDWTFDLLVDGRLHQRQRPPLGEVSLRFDAIPEGEHRLELYLPHYNPVKVKAVRIDDGASAKPVPDRPVWLTYGSSITQCGSVFGPSETWPAIVANRLGLDLVCLGYSGACQIEPTVARIIAEQPADYISLCLGINCHDGHYSERTFRGAVIGLIRTIRQTHPQTPIAVVSPIYSPPRESTPGNSGMTLQSMRQWIQQCVAAIREVDDDSNLHYINGLDLFGPEQARYLPDGLHPSAQGYVVLAERYLQQVMPLLGLSAPVPNS